MAFSNRTYTSAEVLEILQNVSDDTDVESDGIEEIEFEAGNVVHDETDETDDSDYSGEKM